MAAKKDSVIKSARRFVQAVQRSGIELEAAYLYGSFASGTPHADSDIDVALVSKDLTGGVQDLEKLGVALRRGDSRIENVRFHPRNFVDENPLVWEIKSRGIPLIPTRLDTSRKRRLNTNAVVNYWLKEARFHWKFAQGLVQDKRYAYALIFGRLYLEKLLKAVIVEKTHAHAPFRQPLLALASLTGINFNSDQRALLERVENYTQDSIDDPENHKQRQLLTRQYCEQELKSIRRLGRLLQSHLKK